MRRGRESKATRRGDELGEEETARRGGEPLSRLSARRRGLGRVRRGREGAASREEQGAE